MKQQVVSRALEAMAPQERLNLAEARHRECEARLRELGRRTYMTPAEQVEAADLKKKKLLAKDEITSLRRNLT
ncbi:DUF465 domain-containing protein [Chondromyces apiculatus]|uniref:DUF465 domain-containing protein n=1 Tax=Chondromyces apiculatus DSM 436 TaxID=1192034 RepID=A0A017SWD0_9BACT|nr:DUF465 domain-containing protein [Chondromyces apiculatus]EYF01284.1 Hypothetical protein CAP_8438 [Chondromyces apiculatus DSM 436]